MTNSCKEFDFLIDRKKIYSENDIPSLILYNKCLTSEVDILNKKIDKLDETNQSHTQELGKLKEQILASKEIQSQKFEQFNAYFDAQLNKLESTQNLSVSSYEHMFETSKDIYSDLISIIGIFFTAIGLLTICYMARYKKREIQELTDNTLLDVCKKLDSENYTQGLVANALETVFVSKTIDTKLEIVATDVENRIMTCLADRGVFKSCSFEEITNSTAAEELKSVLEG